MNSVYHQLDRIEAMLNRIMKYLDQVESREVKITGRIPLSSTATMKVADFPILKDFNSNGASLRWQISTNDQQIKYGSH